MWVLFGFLHVLQLLMIRFTQQQLVFQICNDKFAKIGLKLKPPLIHVWFSEVHVCCFLYWIYMSFQLCPLLSEE